MKYSVVRIMPNRERWTAFVEEVDGDRVGGKTAPNSSLGFYWFPITTSPQVAFRKLKHSMVVRHKKEIRKLQRSLVELDKLTLK